MFSGFQEWHVSLPTGVALHGRSGGAGPAVVLVHGHPRAHTTWHRVAPVLVAHGFTVICPDLRGYGRSSKPDPDSAHVLHSDRTMSEDIVALMQYFGHQTFAIIGHDRGQGVAYRTAMDHPRRVTALGVLDGLPMLEQLERVNARFATEWWHWFFFTGSPHAHRVITADPEAWYGLDNDLRERMGSENFDYVAAAIRDPLTVRSMLEDYRAGLSVDAENDREDRRLGRTIQCPVLIAWSALDDMIQLHGDLASIWAPWVSGPITTAAINSGHHMAEENPEQLSEVLSGFLGAQL